MASKKIQFNHVNYLWNDEVAKSLNPVDGLVYRSNILGADQRITNTGGGNTSAKILEVDPLTGNQVEVLWVKGSGGDLRTSKSDNFSSLYIDKLQALKDIYYKSDEVGVKTQIEDDMVDMYRHATFNLNPRATSIDTPLHAYIPFKHVDHMHPNSVIAVAASKNSKKLTEEIWGGELIWTEWQRPGFDLGMKLQQICNDNPNAKGVILAGHGVINWANDNKECYDLSLDIIEKAAEYIEKHDKGEMTFGGQKYITLEEDARKKVLVEIVPFLRGLVSSEKKLIGTIQQDDNLLRFVNSVDAARLADLGTSCPDHFLRTKIKPLYVAWNPQTDSVEKLKTLLKDGIEAYQQQYTDYYENCKHDNSPAQRASSPSICLIPGVGMIAWGKNKSESRVTAEFYNCAIEVMRGAEAIDEYIALPQQEAFDIEYWLLEEAKLQRMPKEKSLARDVVVVIGAGDGIGKETAFRVAQEGAHVVCADLRLDAAKITADELALKYGQGIGVAGSGISGCGTAIAQSVDITNRQSVREMFENVILAYGGIDKVIVTAGVFLAPGQAGMSNDEMFDISFAVNVKGGYIVGTEANSIWQAQGLPGALVLTTSVNGVVSKKGSLAYDTSKSAANHLVRELAVSLSPLVNVNGLAPATVVKGSTMFPRDRVIASLKKYDVVYSESDSDDELRDKLAMFYAQRTLTKQPITPADQAEAAYLLISGQLSKTTGQIISVDGGLSEAFLR
ncbi:bifunctional rhamnulose-1-phosphate aldolase/short-chain dehydrogenase [Rheinheimera sp. UJ51]|uniref:bifunctional rhamnulose-1-phosphate aldolase/short-chain dehydrogenase n=1 Tax=unclassified Rheinheimera TaxID=115860 RepID=UPI001E3ED9E3|nr:MULTISPECIES: bifunctional rhamnulose-1-phosphate aldolase/short-chain dehydrogenase [unclassified Rheinheimera]MCC5453288.1 bifunctional rhamnulose-1-phosphate aldolase/short-chain dehydrogenase [Rheinheimera sp. UJ51]MCF4010938.1 bifunctional rhamnulose-1-phosphate aldolase/short-chain dehydrogenase [Rheinheimera sp. UJ63]